MSVFYPTFSINICQFSLKHSSFHFVLIFSEDLFSIMMTGKQIIEADKDDRLVHVVVLIDRIAGDLFPFYLKVLYFLLFTYILFAFLSTSNKFLIRIL